MVTGALKALKHRTHKGGIKGVFMLQPTPDWGDPVNQ